MGHGEQGAEEDAWPLRVVCDREHRLEHYVWAAVRCLVGLHQQRGSLEEKEDDETDAEGVKRGPYRDAVRRPENHGS